MADLKPDRVRAAELAQTGTGRGRARGEKIEREHESTRALFEHLNPSELAVVPSGMRPKNFVGIESLVSVGVGGSERESDDSVSVDTNASHSTDLSLENGKWLDMDAAIQRCSLHEEGEGHEKGGAGGQIGANGGGSAAPRWELQDEATWPRMRG